MRNVKKYVSVGLLLVLAVALVGVPEASALSSIKTAFNNKYGTTGSTLDTCDTCHTPALFDVGVSNLMNYYGRDLFNNNTDFAAIEGTDSDGDGFTNLEEITARTFPGDPNSHPAPAPAPDTPPVINSVTLSTNTPNTGDSITVTVSATDDVAVTSVTADGVSLTLSGSTWTGTITAVEGTHTVNVTASDGAGHSVTDSSQSYTATTLSIPPVPPAPGNTSPPAITITSPVDGSTVNTSTVTVNGTAIDDVGVTNVTVNGVPVTITPGTSVTYSTTVTLVSGSNTITAEARDAAGNSGTATVNVTFTPSAPAPEPVPVPPAQAVLSTVVISPSPRLIINPGDTQQFTVETLDQDGKHIDAVVTWSVTKLAAGSITDSGLFTAANTASTQVTYVIATATSGDVRISNITKVVVKSLHHNPKYDHEAEHHEANED